MSSAVESALLCMEEAEAAPQPVQRARAALNVLLRGLRASSWPQVAWQFSSLTPDGFPLELTFSSSPEPAVRFAAEVAGPEMPDRQRIHEAFRLYHLLAGCPASPEIRQIMFSIQAGRELAYGAWFGGAHTRTADRYKIYAEVPKGACLDKFLPAIFQEGMPPARCCPRPVMLGYQPDSGVHEVYYRAANLEPEHIGKLLWKNNLSHRYQEMLELIRATAGRPGAIAVIAGLSLAFNGDPAGTALSFFTEAKFLFGSDASARRILLDLAKSRSWPLRGYEQVTRSHQSYHDPGGNQGVIAWIVRADSPVELRISIRPPEPT